MKLLSIYELVHESNTVYSKTLVHQVVVETEEELSNIISLLNSQALLINKDKSEDEYVSYSIKLSGITPAYNFINEFVNLYETRKLLEFAKRINDNYDDHLVVLE